LAGDGIDQVPGSNLSINSTYFSVDESCLTREQLGPPYPVVSFELTAAPNAPFGDYSIKLQANSGETAFVPGALTIDPGVSATGGNPIDDYRFFISQHYADMMGREPDQTTLDKLTAQFNQCGARGDCLKTRRLDLSTSLLTQSELSATGLFLHDLYVAGLGRRPRFAEYETDRATVANFNSEIEDSRIALALAFVQRADFQRRYPTTLKPAEFVDQLLANAGQRSNPDIKAERPALLGLFDAMNSGRAAILARVASHSSVVDAQYNEAFVMLQYFSYLRRDPDESGLNLWMNTLKTKPLRDPAAARLVACSFMTSAEYQNRFGMIATHTNAECGN